MSPPDLAETPGGQPIRDLVDLYKAYCDRAPDALGLLFWVRAHLDDLSMEKISTQFWSQPEAAYLRDIVSGPGLLVEEIHQHVLNLMPDAAGKADWSNEIAAGRLPPDAFVLRLPEGARSDLKPDLGPDFVSQQLADQAYLEKN